MSAAREKLERQKVLASVLAERGDALAVASLGISNYDLFEVGDAPENVYLWNAMGITASIGLGLAVAQPDRRVLVVAGDGDMLMGIGTLATIAVRAPPNLAILVMDNERFEETGSQAGLTAGGVDIAAIARGAGFRDTVTVSDEAGVAGLAEFLLRRPGPVLAVAKVKAGAGKPAFPSMDGPALARDFRAALAG